MRGGGWVQKVLAEFLGCSKLCYGSFVIALNIFIL